MVSGAPCHTSRIRHVRQVGAADDWYVCTAVWEIGNGARLPIPSDHPTLAEFMRDAGYVTGQIGKWDIGCVGQGPHERGFMEVAKDPPGTQYIRETEDGGTAYLTDLNGDSMVEFVDRNAGHPFFLYFCHSRCTQRLKRHHNGTEIVFQEATAPPMRRVVAVDDAVGKLLSALRKHGLEQETLILLTGDNGANITEGGTSEPYRGGKGKYTQQEGWVHTPTIISWPQRIPAGKTYSGLMGTIDFYATVAAAAGHRLPARCDGKNLLPFLVGDLHGDMEYLFWHNADPTDAPRRNIYAVRWKQWRLIKADGVWASLT